MIITIDYDHSVILGEHSALNHDSNFLTVLNHCIISVAQKFCVGHCLLNYPEVILVHGLKSPKEH